MEEVLLRFPHIGEDIFKELGGKNFCKSMEVSRSWNYFIRNERALQKAYKNHKAYKKVIQEKIQTLTKEIDCWAQSCQSQMWKKSKLVANEIIIVMSFAIILKSFEKDLSKLT